MKRFIRKNRAIFFLVVVLCLFCAASLFACDGEVTLGISLEGEIVPGGSLSPSLVFTGAERRVRFYSEKDFELTVVRGEAFAAVKDGVVTIAEDAVPGSEFTLRAAVGSLSVEETYSIGFSPVREVLFSLPESAEAGERLALSAEVLPLGATGETAIFEVVSGNGSIEGNELIISSDADFGDEISVRASAGGVYSEVKSLAVSTVQTKNLFLSADEKTCPPGGSIRVDFTKEPSNASFPIIAEITRGATIASYDSETGILSVSAGAEMGKEIVLAASCGARRAEETFTVGYPAIRSITPIGGKETVRPSETHSFSYTVFPAAADPSAVRISLVQGAEIVEWRGGTSFTVNASARAGDEIVFLLEASDEVYSTLSFLVETAKVDSLYLAVEGNTSYAKSGEILTLSSLVTPSTYAGSVRYIVKEGEDLVTVAGEFVTVKDGAGKGTVRIAARAEDGTESNEIAFTVSGRYSRRVYSSWSNVSLSPSDENECVWMVLPEATEAGGITVVVPREVVDLVIEGRYDGQNGIYKNLCFYFRNAPERTVTLSHFATEATYGFGGTVLDFGSSGSVEIVLEGENFVRADSPYSLNSEDVIVDGVWNTGFYYESQIAKRRSGKDGYNGSSGGTAISGYALSFKGSGKLTAAAGSGTNGISGGKGADAEYTQNVISYLSGAGGNGGAGGDSGRAIHAYRAAFACTVVALPGNAGMGGKGGMAGSLEYLAGRDVTAVKGKDGASGANGIPYPAIDATIITGSGFTSSVGRVVSLNQRREETLSSLADKISRYYGVGLYYGNSLYNPYKNLSKSKRYVMEAQTDPAALLGQANFLAYTMTQMPKNCWREVLFLSTKQVTIYLAKSITSGSGGTILGLTSDANRVWFATFGTEVRGVLYGGYFSIMLHEFTHLFHYNFTSSSARSAFESELKSYNYSLAYKSAYGSVERVYGVSPTYGADNSCFLSTYSRKSVMEDAAETLSLVSTLTVAPDFLAADCHIRKKYDALAGAFSREYETLSRFSAPNLFGYPHLFD